MMEVTITKSKKKDKKFDANIKSKGSDKNISFGASGYSDFTKHKDEKRKERYIARHKKNENWTKSGIDTAGFYSKHLLWNENSFDKSFKDLKKKFPSITFTYK